jgi:hypothetical protein
LSEFFELAPGFHLTGGAALVGFYLYHRTTADLDLFSDQARLEEGEAALQEVTRRLDGVLERVSTSPTFRRLVLHASGEDLVVDLVQDPSCAGGAAKVVRDGIRIDPPEEILANKLCTLLSRAEIRDLVDLRALEASGLDALEALPRAMEKDGGLTSAQLAWVLSSIRIGADANPPGGVSSGELQAYLEDLVARLARVARPA